MRRPNAIGISRGAGTTKIHAIVDVLGRPLRLVLTLGNTSDVKGADLLIGETMGMKRVIVDRGYDPNRIRARLPRAGHDPDNSWTAQPQTPQSNMTSADTKIAGGSKRCSAGLRTFAGLPLATTRWQGTSCQPSISPPPSHSDSEQVSVLLVLATQHAGSAAQQVPQEVAADTRCTKQIEAVDGTRIDVQLDGNTRIYQAPGIIQVLVEK